MKSIVKGSSLFHAIMVCIVISVFCAGFVLFASYSRITEDIFIKRSELFRTNKSVTDYILSDFSVLESRGKFSLSHNGITSTAFWKNWGCYRILEVKSFGRRDSISNTVMMGAKEMTPTGLVLYVSDRDKRLKLSGEILIEGDMYISGGTFDHAYLNGKKGNSIEHQGRKIDSKSELPKISFPDFDQVMSNSTTENLHNFIGVEIFQPFHKKTKVLKVEDGTVLKNLNLKGNIIIECEGDLSIGANVTLTDVIIKAHSVQILSGFRGNLQVVAQSRVLLDEDVSLLYPSGIYVNNPLDSTSVQLKSHTKVAGTIILGDGSSEFDRSLFKMEKDSEVLGDVYCSGLSIFNGKITGRIFTGKVGIIGETGISDNVILNTELDGKGIPESFMSGLFFKSDSIKTKHEIIKQL